MRFFRLFVFGAALLTLAACGRITDFALGEDNNEPPAPLNPIESPIAVRTNWSQDVGSGGGRGASQSTDDTHHSESD